MLATYLLANTQLDYNDSHVPYVDAAYAAFTYYPPELNFIQAEAGCVSSTASGPLKGQTSLGYPWVDIIKKLLADPTLGDRLKGTPARDLPFEVTAKSLKQSIASVLSNMSSAHGRFPGGAAGVYDRMGKDILTIAQLFNESYSFDASLGPGDPKFDMNDPTRGLQLMQESVAELAQQRQPRPLTRTPARGQDALR